ncbi:MAG: DUF1615 domain-containing protein [Thermomonas sp.]
MKRPCMHLRRCAPWIIAAAVASLAACDLLDRGPTPEQVRAEIVKRIPNGVADRAGWARDIQAAFAAQELQPTTAHLCAVIAVVGQESGFQADPPVPNLPAIARKAIGERAARLHVPGFVVDAALAMRAPDGRTYSERLDALRTEQQLSALFEEMTARLPLGSGRLFARLNPVHTAGPMQVGIAFAQSHARGYPYPLQGSSIRHEVFSRRGGLYFGTKHLLGYKVAYPELLYRFADYNAGWYASRNAAFQHAVSVASGKTLARDGDLLRPGAAMDAPGATEAALRTLGPALGMDDAALHRALGRGESPSFDESALYRQVFALADRKAGKPLPRALLPEIDLHSPKITRPLSTAWFAQRVDARWKQCMAR